MAPTTPMTFSQEGSTLQHFTHSHILTKDLVFNQYEIQKEGGYDSNEFVCDACHTLGSGVRYHCKQCSFDIHEDCANYPQYMYMYPNHQLELVWEGSDESIKKANGQLRPCDVCGDEVKGLFYISSSAEKWYGDGRQFFFIHPLCSKFPSQVHHAIDRNHPLKFQSVPVIPNSLCSICRDVVYASSWSYRCDPCGVNIHLECVTLPFDNHHTGIAYASRSIMDPQAQMHQQRGLVQPTLGTPAYGGYAGTTPPPYNNYGPTPYDYSPYPPPDHNYYYQQPLQPYGHSQMSLPPYYKGTTSSTTGGKKKMTAAAVGKIAVKLLLSVTTGGILPIKS